MAGRDALAGSPPIDTLTEFESFSSPGQESTTSNTPVIKSGYPITTTDKTAGSYLINYSVQMGQGNNGRVSQLVIEWRAGTTGTWIELFNTSQELGNTGYSPWAGFSIVELPVDNVFQVRVSYANPGQGSCLIREANITIGKVSG